MMRVISMMMSYKLVICFIYLLLSSLFFIRYVYVCVCVCVFVHNVCISVCVCVLCVCFIFCVVLCTHMSSPEYAVC